MSKLVPEIVVLASGNGSNFHAIINAVKTKKINARIRCLIVDRQCGAIKHANDNKVSFFHVDRHNNKTLNLNVLAMLCHEADLIVLAGYLSILDTQLINIFPKKIINIHPSLLPKYAGKNMYGMNVHQAVIDAGDTESGCTIHYVDEGIDTGEMIAQEIVSVGALDDAQSLADKVLKKEHTLLVDSIKDILPNQ